MVSGVPLTWAANCAVRPVRTWALAGLTATATVTVVEGATVVTWVMASPPGWVT